MKAQEIGTRCFVFHTTLKLDCKTVRIFAYSSTRKQSNEAENRERDWGETLKIRFFFLSPHTPYGSVRIARFARVRLLRHALQISLLILRKKTDCFAVYLEIGSLSNFITGQGGSLMDPDSCLLRLFQSTDVVRT